jgi:hypothetical protein
MSLNLGTAEERGSLWAASAPQMFYDVYTSDTFAHRMDGAVFIWLATV